MQKIIWASISGLIFATGLMISGMANPAKVIGFLDITGVWDPSLAFVMGGAIMITLPGFLILKRNGHPIITSEGEIDFPLILGAVLFGIGWALVGLCPGPAWTMVASAPKEAVYFILAMLAGLFIGGKIKFPQKG